MHDDEILAEDTGLPFLLTLQLEHEAVLALAELFGQELGIIWRGVPSNSLGTDH